MAIITAISDTSICNMALGRDGAERINDIEDTSESSVNAILCRLHYSQTRDALIRSHWWRMARARKELSANTTDEPLGEWDYAYDLPADFLRMKKPYEDLGSGNQKLRYTYSLEGKQLLSNESPMEIQYIRRVTDPTEFDPLFVEVFVLQLALKMAVPIAGAGNDGLALRKSIIDELYNPPIKLMSRVRVIDRQETNTTGMTDLSTWNQALIAGAGDPAKRYT